MKRIKSIMMCAFALLTFCALFANVQTVHAASYVNGNIYVNPVEDVKGNIKDCKKVRVTTYADSISSFDVRYGSGDKIANLKVNKKGLEARVTDTENYSSYGEADISLYATKPATYKVSFDVVNSKNQKRGHYIVQVQAVNSSSVIKKAVFGKQTVESNSASIKKGVKKNSSKSSYKVKGKSGKFKITANSQYKITGIVVVSVNKKGQYVYKKFKNGKKLALSQNYDSISTDAYWGITSKPLKKYTYIYVSYKDKFFGHTQTYSISKARGRKEIKSVYKNGITGSRTTNYYRRPSATIELWQY
ncbi:MAG: hypothetical protein K2L07_01675 [Lachnospiraceae bacterium]|nr:hypothetical protein [Lachnospiraceae bacterium]